VIKLITQTKEIYRKGRGLKFAELCIVFFRFLQNRCLQKKFGAERQICHNGNNGYKQEIKKVVYSECLLRLVVLRVSCCSKCLILYGDHFVMVPLNLTCLHCSQHFFFKHFSIYIKNILKQSQCSKGNMW